MLSKSPPTMDTYCNILRKRKIASNDGYLLQYFKETQIPCLGIEPSANTAQAAREKGIETLEEFFGVNLARSLSLKDKKADLIIGNNVLAHVPDINDFVSGLRIALKNDGVITMEFPHLMRLIEENQFDTIYHEHFSYLSFHIVRRIFAEHGLVLFDVEELATHGGSLRIYARHDENDSKPVTPNVAELLESASFISYRAEKSREEGCCLWSGGKGEYTFKLLWYKKGFNRVRCGCFTA